MYANSPEDTEVFALAGNCTDENKATFLQRISEHDYSREKPMLVFIIKALVHALRCGDEQFNQAYWPGMPRAQFEEVHLANIKSLFLYLVELGYAHDVAQHLRGCFHDGCSLNERRIAHAQEILIDMGPVALEPLLHAYANSALPEETALPATIGRIFMRAFEKFKLGDKSEIYSFLPKPPQVMYLRMYRRNPPHYLYRKAHDNLIAYFNSHYRDFITELAVIALSEYVGAGLRSSGVHEFFSELNDEARMLIAQKILACGGNNHISHLLCIGIPVRNLTAVLSIEDICAMFRTTGSKETIASGIFHELSGPYTHCSEEEGAALAGIITKLSKQDSIFAGYFRQLCAMRLKPVEAGGTGNRLIRQVLSNLLNAIDASSISSNSGTAREAAQMQPDRRIPPHTPAALVRKSR